MKYIKSLVFSFVLFSSVCFADTDLISIFPLANYDQTVSTWLNASDSNYDKSLVIKATQETQFQNFYNHYFGSFSPWNADYVNKILHKSAPDDLKSVEQSIIASFNNQDKPESQIGYGENFRPYSADWINGIAANIMLDQFNNLNYQSEYRAIAVDNLPARVLPTNDVHFYNFKLAGQGYPFDNLQMSALWAGTPLYIIAETHDKAWDLVISPDYIAWVKSSGIARVDNGFVTAWTSTAKNRFAAITHNKTSIVDDKDIFRFTAYTGSVFPAIEAGNNFIKLMIPAADENRHAVMHYATISANNGIIMPYTVTPHHIATVMTTLIGRAYGWGNMYFYNDCSAELKNLFAPFGIWLPRHSSDQVYAGRMVDMTTSSQQDRLAYLMNYGHRLMTIIYIGGHVILYVGNYPNPNSSAHESMAMTYQNIWGLSPSPAIRRAVIGQSVLFPMLLQYPEDATLSSLANKKFFQVAFLDELPNYASLFKLEEVDLHKLMYP